MARPLDHHLHTTRATAVDEFAENVELAKLCGIACVGQAAGPQAIAKRNSHIVFDKNIKNLIPMRIKRILDLVLHHPFGHNRAAAGDDAHDALHRNRNVLEEETRMERHEVDALFRLRTNDIEKEGRIHLGDIPFQARDRLIDGHCAKRLRARVQHSLSNGLQIVGANREIHHEISSGVEGDLQFLKLVALPGMRDAATEIGVDLRREHTPDPNRVRVLMMDVERNHRLTRGDGRAHRLDIDMLIRRDDLHRLGHKALLGRLQLRHYIPPPALSGSGTRVFSQPLDTRPPAPRVRRIFYHIRDEWRSELRSLRRRWVAPLARQVRTILQTERVHSQSSTPQRH